MYLPSHMLILQCDVDKPPARGGGLMFPHLETGWTFVIALTKEKGRSDVRDF